MLSLQRGYIDITTLYTETSLLATVTIDKQKTSKNMNRLLRENNKCEADFVATQLVSIMAKGTYKFTHNTYLSY